MYSRLLNPPTNQSFFLFGPRGTGKSFWLREHYPNEITFDLLDPRIFKDFLARPERLEERIPIAKAKGKDHFIIIHEVQKIPELLDVVHRLIETKGLKFILTGSNARKLKRGGANLLAGRAFTRHLYPLTSIELGADFSIAQSLRYGTLPAAVKSGNSAPDFLNSYVTTYLKEEILAEGILRNLGAFSRFLESASFSQAEQLKVSNVAEDCGISRKVAEDYFQVLEDLLLAERIPVFSKRAKRKVASHPKFMFFDAGLFRTLRPRGILDLDSEIDGAAIETIVWQEIKALNDYLGSGYQIFYWRTHSKLEVDFVLYGPNGFHAIEVKRSHRVRAGDLDGLKAFLNDYPQAKCVFVYTGTRAYHESGIDIVPIEEWFGVKGFGYQNIFAHTVSI
jgi:predicted AAA+ superfamily ATPase